MPRTVPAALAAAALLAALLPPVEPLPGRSSPDPGDTAWMFAAAAVAALAVRAFTPRRSVVAAAVLAWIGLGFSLAHGGSLQGLIGDPRTFPGLAGVGAQTHAGLAPTVPLASFALVQLVWAVVGAALATRGARRPARWAAAYVLLVHAPITHWTHPGGFLRSLGVLDFGGGAACFLGAGTVALAQAWIDRTPGGSPLALDEPPPASEPVAPGWLSAGVVGLVAGATGAASPLGTHALLATVVAVAMGALLGPGGCVAAAAAIVCAAGFVPIGAAALIGAIAAAAGAWAAPRAPRGAEGSASIVAGAVVGLLSVGVFGTTALDPDGGDGLLRGTGLLLAWQAVGLVFVIAWAYAVTWLGHQLATTRLLPQPSRPTGRLPAP